MSFWDKLKASMARWMAGRHGTDNLGIFTLIAGLVLSLAGSISRIGMLGFLGMALYLVTIFRMLSRNQEARIRENQKYMALTGNWSTKITQFIRRMKNRKEYKYFKCEKCRTLIRLRRGGGEKTVVCPKCGHTFKKKT